jgi:HEPN domain-containing protein
LVRSYDARRTCRIWIESASHDLETAEHLFNSGKYDWSLFIANLVLEKTLKALFVFNQENRVPPKTYNLLKLADLAKLELSDNQKIFLDEVNDFNLEARYPDYKMEFYQRCTLEYCKYYFLKIKDFFEWLKSQIR